MPKQMPYYRENIGKVGDGINEMGLPNYGCFIRDLAIFF